MIVLGTSTAVQRLVVLISRAAMNKGNKTRSLCHSHAGYLAIINLDTIFYEFQMVKILQNTKQNVCKAHYEFFNLSIS